MNQMKYKTGNIKFFAFFFSCLFYSFLLYPIEMKMVVELVAIMVIQSAAGEANAILNEKQAAVFAVMQKYVQSVSTDFSTWAKQEVDFFTQEAKGIQQVFSNQQTQIAGKQTDMIAQAQLEMDYITKNMNNAQPAQNFVQYPIIFDQRFEVGALYTPDYKTPWYNMTPVGDWMYDPTTKSLFQNTLVDLYTQDAQGGKSAVYAENNIVFTEWYPSKMPYTLQGSVALHKVSYPFFVGIIFNKARWISGNQDCIRKYRAVGIFATSAQDAGVYFVEEIDGAGGEIEMIIDLLLAQKVKPLFAIPESDLTTMAAQEVVYDFSITPTAQDISIQWAKHGSDQAPQVQKVSSQNQLLYLYHGVGCMSTGAVTEWKITGPAELLKSQASKSTGAVLPVKKGNQSVSSVLVQK